MSSKQPKIIKCKENKVQNENQQKQETTEIAPQRLQMLELSDTDF